MYIRTKVRKYPARQVMNLLEEEEYEKIIYDPNSSSR